MSRDDDTTALQGSDPETVRQAIAAGDPLPGTAGYAGVVDGTLVRDVLGRYPLFVDGDAWAFDPASLDEPTPVPAGTVRTPDGEVHSVTLPDPDPLPLETAIARLRSAIETARATIPDESVAVAFSGGVDSAVVAALVDGPCYVVGFPGSADLEAATRAAEAMDRSADLVTVTVDHAALERAIPAVARATGRTNAMDVAIAASLWLVAERVAADGHSSLALGQGADELFGGYEKVARVDHRVEADTPRGAARELIEGLPDQLERDVLTLRAAGVEPVTPLLHDDVVDAALRLPESGLVDASGVRKAAFRTVAREFVPPSVAERRKKAVQYGILVARELDRLARQAGFKRRMDDHVSRYVESTLE